MSDLKEGEGNSPQTPREVIISAVKEAKETGSDLSLLILESSPQFENITLTHLNPVVTQINRRTSVGPAIATHYIPLPRFTIEGSLDVAEQLLEEFPSVAHDGTNLGVSIGLAFLDKTQDTAASLELKATLALEAAQKEGSNKIGIMVNRGQKLSVDQLSPLMKASVILIHK